MLKKIEKTFLSGILLTALSVPALPAAETVPEGVVTTMPPLTTKRPYLPRKKSGYAFVSNIEQIAYVAAESSSMIHFTPVNPSHKPKLFIALPPEIRLQGAYRDLSVSAPEKTTLNGREMDLYKVSSGPRVSKYTFFWRLTRALPEGTALTGYYWGEWSKGKQAPQKLNIQVVSIPEAKEFKSIPVYLSMPNDFYSAWPDTAGLRRAGFNYLDMWMNPTGAFRIWTPRWKKPPPPGSARSPGYGNGGGTTERKRTARQP